MSVTLEPASLPSVDIVGLAQSGQILRAERDTPPDGVPVFITREGWNDLLATHATDSASSPAAVLPALEKAVTRIMAHAAEAAGKEGMTTPVISMKSDLFSSDGTLILAFVRDSTHPVACALIGTATQIADTLRAGPSGQVRPT
ncbi:hypothetical protein [Gluconobacter morbifer]|uniref:Uncharacterized protein n=1 Tax=Gluconobacter morbifer G707 TaxID=1088869 RepID=G6XFX2_9PROT|nr:hypothetical protein [Gluconobacter morbifer]EHH69080.1 hypothetical protein GMO_03870 [Gluconobacter morbifer G707]